MTFLTEKNKKIYKCVCHLFYVNIFSLITIYAQTKTTFSYDSRGNRTVMLEKGAAPIPKLTASQSSVNPNELVTITASGCTGGTITWSPGGVVGNELQVQPTATTTYKATCTVSGCEPNYNSIKITVVQCPTIPSIIITNSKTNIKYGEEFILTATNCGNQAPDYNARWSNGYIGDQLKIQQFQNSQTYTVTCFDPNCPSIGTGSISVNATLPASTCESSFIYSVKDGDWSDPTTWSCVLRTYNGNIFYYELPSLKHTVYIRHKVDVNQNGEALKIIDGGGVLNFNNNIYSIRVSK